MAKRYFNWKLALVILIGTVVLAATALALRRWQKSSRADRGLQLGVEAYEEHRWEEAATQLGRFVAVNRDRVDVLLLYAKAQLNVRPLSRDGVGLAVSALRSILRRDEGHTEATRELAETYLMMGSPGEAELITERCLRQLDVNDLDVERLLVHAMIRQRKFDESKSRLMSVIDAHPDRIWPYELLAYVEHLANQVSATRL
jgi:lipopolysaccharide biosynthesis regulator YciM